MKIRFIPQEIATQIIILLILSAIIFHLCISAAFLIGRGYFPQRDVNEESRFLAHIGDFMKTASELPAPSRDQMLAWLKEDKPWIDLETEPAAQSQATPETEKVISLIQSHAGPNVKVDGGEASNRLQRAGFEFEDGMHVSVKAEPEGSRPPEWRRQPGPTPSLGTFPPEPPRETPSGDLQSKGLAASVLPLASANPPPGPPRQFRLPGSPPNGGPSMIPVVFGTLLFVAISFTIFLLWAARALTQPLKRFAEAADGFPLNEAVTPLAENGPSELRGAARALNRMRERVKGMIEQRTQMLAAISHDLRTPITRLRLRAEFIEQSEIREPILHDIEQMNAMVHSALSFIRDGVEARRDTLLDLSALLQTICDEFSDIGHEVSFEAAEPISIKGNVDELYRAVTNLVSNAVKFGTKVEVRLRRGAQNYIEVEVIDDGPGITEQNKAAMLEPFARGDEARQVEDLQGFGLGLPIVQAIVTAHRGLLHLLNREPCGLIARITLPAA